VSWHLANASVWGREAPCDLLLRDGRVYLLQDTSHARAGARYWNLEGRLVLPGLVEMHTHLDKTYTPGPNPAGTLRGAIESYRAVAAGRSSSELEARAVRALEAAVANGVTRLRSHVNLSDPADLPVLEVLTGVRQAFAGRIDVQFVAMLSLGPGYHKDLLAEGVRLGIDLVGGAPALEDDPRAAVDRALGAALRFELPLDLHIDETDDPSSETLRYLAERVLATGFPLPVTASHCCALAFQTRERLDDTLDLVARGGISVVALPACNLFLVGRGRWPSPRGMAPLNNLLAHGITVCAGADNVQDPFNPYGDYDPLRSAQLCALVGQLSGDDAATRALELVCGPAAGAFAGHDARLTDGAEADLVVMDTSSPSALLAETPPRLATFKSGRLVMRSRCTREWPTGDEQ
jgi:cytosine deaminase